MEERKQLQFKIADDLLYFTDKFQKVNGAPRALQDIGSDLNEYLKLNYLNIHNSFSDVFSFTLQQIIKEMMICNSKREYPGCQYVYVPSVYKMHELAEAYYEFLNYTYECEERLQRRV